MCFPAGLLYPFILPFGKVRIYGDIKTSFLGKVRIKTHRFLRYFGHSCLESYKKCRPAGKHIISSGPSSVAAEIILEIYAVRVPLE